MLRDLAGAAAGVSAHYYAHACVFEHDILAEKYQTLYKSNDTDGFKHLFALEGKPDARSDIISAHEFVEAPQHSPLSEMRDVHAGVVAGGNWQAYCIGGVQEEAWSLFGGLPVKCARGDPAGDGYGGIARIKSGSSDGFEVRTDQQCDGGIASPYAVLCYPVVQECR
ncbi:hypothetical protein CYMTET_17870 [Cymbomonas tetramitiformis]|uniref:Uncharacterized protein n=1 Tax=Cymbomonas tetramitiformis TaxID=36881 RepID=A0AAE0L6Q3_9CHLO|nr:hypothetical protein CYMTET_17870 [Cymbomonas tetramitiformis]